ncbi:MAG: Mu transposase C-terminal domain-containing protein [Dolichospermum sp. DET50]|nr:Mu transposase C-terminal domain-containing protein [Dolichospermum sp. DET66]MBS3035574.1 Mu transposase C-terminal domain-containing protein [Dolichospermum sp. DET67]MBS3040776.1 Mu transposase C-terminal domain-containing protein [Dolichospermum sp. DET50]QSX67894.1 MAG: Mu transposase C-terminal domain-containing protein [Dolichospermum sp. DET69]
MDEIPIFNQDNESLPFDDNNDLAEIQNDEPEETNVIITELSAEAKLKMEVIQGLLEPCDRKTYGQKLRVAAEKLGKTVRTVQRLVKKYQQDGLSAIVDTERNDKGSYRIDPEWQKFIISTFKEGNKGSKKMTPAQVAIRVQVRAGQLGLEDYPSHMTVYRVLNPIIERQEQKQKVRNVGWRGSRVSHKTRDGQTLDVHHSNHVWQCDHTKLDVMLVDQYGEPLSRPWFTKITDSYSRCIMGIHLGFDAPSSQVVALALRHAILPKQYSAEYKLHCEWATYGVPENLFTDGGRDFRSDHLKQIGFQLAFECHLRDRPSEGGIEERSFGTINTEFLSGFYGYLGSNIQERSKTAEEEACLTLRELHLLLVRYIIDNYNQRLDARTKEQSRFQRWEAGLPALPKIVKERELDVCLMKKTRRSIYKGGYLSFENILYRGDYLAAYAGESVVLRYDPRDITTVWVYRIDKGKEELLSAAHALDWETEQLSLEEAKAASQKVRSVGKTLSNKSILAEIHDRDTFIKQKKKTQKERKKEEQAQVHPVYESINLSDTELVETPEETPKTQAPQSRRPRVFNYEQLRQDYDE